MKCIPLKYYKMKNLLVLQCLFVLCIRFDAPRETFTDPRDHQIYKTIKIGDQIWFTQNLNYETEESICYKKKKQNCAKYGRLYTFDELDIACPKNWRVPTIKDWETLKSNFTEDAVLDLLDKEGWESAQKHRNTSGLSLQGAGYQVQKRLFIGENKATTLWINQMNAYDEYYHAHLYGGKGTYFERNDHWINEVFHAHPVEDLANLKFSIRCMCDVE